MTKILAAIGVFILASPALADDGDDAARSVMIPLLMQTPMPGGGVMPASLASAISECILEFGTKQEIKTLSDAATNGPDVMTQVLIGQILQRPETTQCASAALGA